MRMKFRSFRCQTIVQRWRFALPAVLVAVAWTGPAVADPPEVPTSDEIHLSKHVSQDYHQGTFTLCVKVGTDFLKKFPDSPLAPQVRLTLAQAYYQLGQSEMTLTILERPDRQIPPPLLADWVFWQAEAELDLKRWPQAEQRYRDLASIQENNPHLDAGKLGLAWALFKQHRDRECQELLTPFINENPTSPEGQSARLLHAKILVSQSQFDAAAMELTQLLGDRLESGTLYASDYWLAECFRAQGKWELAARAYEKITQDSNATPKSLISLAQLGLGDTYLQQGQDDKAMDCFESVYKITENQLVRLDAFKRYLQAGNASQVLPDAINRVEDFGKHKPAAGPDSLFAVADVLAAARSDDNKAITILTDLLKPTSPPEPWRNSAEDLLGQLYVRQWQPELARQAFAAALEGNPDPDLQRDARFNLGLIFYSQGRYPEAIAQFQKVEVDSSDGLAQSAAYNSILAQAALGQKDDVQKAITTFEQHYPRSIYRAQIAMAQGNLLAKLDKPDDAIAAFKSGLQPGIRSDTQQQLMSHLADYFYQINDLASATKAYQDIVDAYPDTSLDAAQRVLLTQHEAQKLTDDQYEQALLALSQKYAKSPQAASVYFRLGEFYFYRHNYVNAQSILLLLATNYPDSPYASDAYFFAGRAAAAHQDFASAQTLLSKVPDSSNFKNDATLSLAWVNHQQNKFETALGLYNTVLSQEKSGTDFVEANLGKGECLFQMATKDPGNLPLAAGTFSQILDSNEGTVEQRNEAAVRKARCLASMNKNDEALGLFLDVLYGRVAGDESAHEQPADFNWQIQGGYEAERIRESQRDWRGAIEVYKRMEEIGGAHKQQFHDSIIQLQRDNYIYN